MLKQSANCCLQLTTNTNRNLPLDLAAAFECATTSYHKDLQDCGLILVNQIYLSSSNMTSDQLFPLICCSFHELVNCIRSAAVPSCTDEKFHLTNFFMGHINRLIKDLIDLLCGKWSTIEQCQLSAPEVFDHLAKLNNVSRFNSDESLLGTILNITAKLSSEDEWSTIKITSRFDWSNFFFIILLISNFYKPN